MAGREFQPPAKVTEDEVWLRNGVSVKDPAAAPIGGMLLLALAWSW
jgi:hypothetical protein